MSKKETIKRIDPVFSDGRGDIINVLEKPITSVAVITSKAGSIRANHYHPDQWQYVYLVSGKYETYGKDLDEENAEVVKQEVNAGDLAITPPMVAHAMKFVEDSVMLNLTTGSRDPDKFEEHTIKYKVIDDE